MLFENFEGLLPRVQNRFAPAFPASAYPVVAPSALEDFKSAMDSSGLGQVLRRSSAGYFLSLHSARADAGRGNFQSRPHRRADRDLLEVVSLRAGRSGLHHAVDEGTHVLDDGV